MINAFNRFYDWLCEVAEEIHDARVKQGRFNRYY